ncbi:MAG: ABC transporter substrate-binding protein [Planctomycetaceae bacterium]|nr:ABC transporter substrate-binding protein [Planctomycetota bacterium]NUN51378.1 ABC transporter substrate-binding protein [Planctomycetaceae bacterium]
MRLGLGSVGPFLLPLAIAAGAVWLGSGGRAPGKVEIRAKYDLVPDTLRVAVLANPPNLDPVEATDTTSNALIRRICNTLVGLDDNLALAPDLCEALPEVSPDGLVYTFRVRAGVKFHNGREMTAEDVKYSLQRLAEPWSKRFWIIEPVAGAEAARKDMVDRKMDRGQPQTPIAGIEALPPRTIRITLEKPQPLFPLFIAMSNASVVPREEVERLGQRFGRELVGTGGFRLGEWKDNAFVVLERFDGYWGPRPPLRRIVYSIMPEEDTGYQGYLNGEQDIVQCPTGKVKLIRSSNLADELVVNPLLDVRFHGVNMEKVLRGPGGEVVPLGGNPEKAADPVLLTPAQKEKARKVRQAMNFAIDRDFLCDVILEGRAVPAKGVIPPKMDAFDPALPGYRYDPARARALLAEAGHPGGEGLPVMPLHFNNQGPNSLIAQALQGMLLDVGIRTEINMMDWGAYQDFIDAGKATIYRMAWIADYPDPENFLFVLFHSSMKGSQGNYARYQDDANDRRLEEARACIDDARRKRLWREAEAAIVEDAPWMFLYHSATALLVKPHVRGLVLTGMDAGSEMGQADLGKVSIEGAGR